MTSCDQLLTELEKVHRQRVGAGRFCYFPTKHPGSAKLWRLSIIEQDEPDHYPITDDLFFGTQNEMTRKALEFNTHRLNLSPREVAVLLFSTTSVPIR